MKNWKVEKYDAGLREKQGEIDILTTDCDCRRRDTRGRGVVACFRCLSPHCDCNDRRRVFQNSRLNLRRSHVDSDPSCSSF